MDVQFTYEKLYLKFIVIKYYSLLYEIYRKYFFAICELAWAYNNYFPV